MDTIVDTYRQCIEKVLCDYAQLPYAYGEVERKVVSDRHGDHYLLLAVGGMAHNGCMGALSTSTSSTIKSGFNEMGLNMALLRTSWPQGFPTILR